MDTRSKDTDISPAIRNIRFRARPRLTWTQDGAEKTFTVEDRVVVGATSQSGIYLRDSTVSRVHAELESREDGLWVRDLMSRNGTWIDGVRVTGGLVPDGGTLRIGASSIRVAYGHADSAAVQMWPTSTFGPLLGDSPKMRELFALLALLAKSEAAVMVQGETGTGKELVARAIHEASPRSTGPFVVVDCAALAESVLDAELFGHARGAFTGSVGQRAGAFEAAHGGTVFLDEIGEVPLALQPKLLRVIESKTVRRLGEVEHRAIDVRFVSATHRDLLAMVAQGLFREDLYFRLSVLPAMLPPLRERPRDVPALLAHFAGRSGGTLAVPQAAAEQLQRHPWAGNVRELRNFVERALALGLDRALATLDGSRGTSLPPPAVTSAPVADEPEPMTQRDSGEMLAGLPQAFLTLPFREFRDRWGEDGERRYVVHHLEACDRDTTRVATAMGIDRSYVYRLMRKYGL